MVYSNVPCLLRSVSIISVSQRVRDDERGVRRRPWRESTSLSTMMNPVLPVSDPPLAGDNDLGGKGSAMTKRGAYAALSYMSCAGKSPQIPADINVKVSCFEIMSVCCVLVFNWQWCLCCSIKQLSLPMSSPVLTLSLSFR